MISLNKLFECFIQGIYSAKDMIEKDYRESGGQCHLMLAKGKFFNPMIGWAIAKNSPHTEAFNMG